MEQETYRPLKIDYHDRKDAFLKTLTFGEYKRYLGRYWRAGRMTMRNHQTGKSTEIMWKDYAFRTGLNERDFTPNKLKRLR